MRKLLAVLLTVLMLASVLAVIPAAAAEVNSPLYDGAASGLLISEICHNSDNWDDDEYASVGIGDAFTYWEIYNYGSETVNIFDFSMVKAPMEKTQPAAGNVYREVWNLWETDKKFTHKMDISTTVIPAKPTTETGEPINIPEGLVLQNDAEKGELKSGECTIIWFINSATIKYFQTLIDDVKKSEYNTGADIDARQLFIQQYSNLNNGYTVPSNINIIMVWGYRNQQKTETGYIPVTDQFTDNDGGKSSGAMYGLVKDSFDLSASAVVGGEKNDEGILVGGTLSSEVVALAEYAGTNDAWKICKGNLTTIFVPSTGAPAYYAADRAYANKPLADAEKVDYLTAGLVDSYAEAGCIMSTATATPGKLDDLQYALYFTDKAPASLSGNNADWATAYLAEKLAFWFPAEGELEDANDEVKITVTPPDRNKLQQIFFPEENEQYIYEKRLSLVGKILIAVGAVVVVGAGAGAAFIIIKKKKAA